jgi:hypothetical protein
MNECLLDQRSLQLSICLLMGKPIPLQTFTIIYWVRLVNTKNKLVRLTNDQWHYFSGTVTYSLNLSISWNPKQYIEWMFI